MSLTKLLKAPIKLFKKDVITFLIVRRYDLGTMNHNNNYLRYIAVKPSASISVLRQKMWYLLELPDYCEEVIILKSPGDVEIPLTELRRGNDPQHPYVLEVWLPGNRQSSTTMFSNMITMGKDKIMKRNLSTDSVIEEKGDTPEKYCSGGTQSTMSTETMALNKLRVCNNLIYSDYKRSDVSCKISKSTLFRISSRKSQDNFTNLLLKIQSDLSTLSNKLIILENKLSA